MEKIIEDALTVQNCLPWVDNNEDIINFMRKIPIDKSYLRIPIALKYFLKCRDNNLVFEHEIEQEAKDIVTVLPNVPYQQVKKKMKMLGNISNRKEVTFRMFLNDREDLDNVLEQMKNDISDRKRSLSENNEPTENTNKVSRIGNTNFNEFIKNNNTIVSNFQKNVYGATILIPNNAVATELPLGYEHPAMAKEVPEVFQLFPTNESSLVTQKSMPNVLQDPIKASTSSSEHALETINHQFLKNTEQDDPPFSIINVSKAGPSRENATKDIFIDLVENDGAEKHPTYDEKLVLRLIEIFPETCPDYIRHICVNKNWSDFDQLVTNIIDDENHPKRQRSSTPPEINPEDQFETVKALLPDADPTYLRMKCEMLEYKPDDLNKFIIQAREKKDYPTMKEYIRNQQLSAQSKQYTTEFSTEQFVQLFPEPHITFNDSKRVVDVDNYSKMYIAQYFQNKYDRLPKRAIYSILVENNFKILQTNDRLMLFKDSSLKMKTRRKHTLLNNTINNILVLQEIAYLEHKDEIEDYIRAIKEKETLDRQYAKDNGLMKTCECCFDDEVMPKDTFYCPKECLFCKDCIRKSCEITFGEGRTTFKCLNDCPEEFDLQTLQNILMPKMFSKLAQKKMIEEIKAAGIEDLEMCPFCDFASIPNEQDKIFKCLNPDCMKESCRNCKEPNHIPLHCDEIEKDENVKARVFIENKMTEALLCKCWKCGTSFFKEEGCNKMTCTCGAQMCYVCKKPVNDYKHFNGMGGDKYHLCPLYSDSIHLNQEKVLTAVKQAKAQIDQSMLKVDPSENLQQYYENQPKKLSQEAPINLALNMGMQPFLFERGRNRNN